MQVSKYHSLLRMGILLLFIAACAASAHAYVAAATCGYAPLYRYCNGFDNFYTTDINDIGTAYPGQMGRNGYTSDGIQAIVVTDPGPNRVPLYQYCNGRDHLYTTSAAEIGTTIPAATGKAGYVFDKIAAYCYAYQTADSVPLYRYCNGADHLYTTDPDEIGTIVYGQMGRNGYRCEGVVCYVLPYGSVVRQ